MERACLGRSPPHKHSQPTFAKKHPPKNPSHQSSPNTCKPPDLRHSTIISAFPRTIACAINPQFCGPLNCIDHMSMTATQSCRKLRWVFIVSEAMVIGHFLLMEFGHRLYPRAYPEPVAIGIVLAYLAALAWLFLLIASPFFFRSLRGLAIAGWIIALAIPAVIWVKSFN
jgi:hypothetical protein